VALRGGVNKRRIAATGPTAKAARIEIELALVDTSHYIDSLRLMYRRETGFMTECENPVALRRMLGEVETAKTLAEEVEAGPEEEAEWMINTGGVGEATGSMLSSVGVGCSGASSGTSTDAAVEKVSGWDIGVSGGSHALTCVGAAPPAAHVRVSTTLAFKGGYDVND